MFVICIRSAPLRSASACLRRRCRRDAETLLRVRVIVLALAFLFAIASARDCIACRWRLDSIRVALLTRAAEDEDEDADEATRSFMRVWRVRVRVGHNKSTVFCVFVLVNARRPTRTRRWTTCRSSCFRPKRPNAYRATSSRHALLTTLQSHFNYTSCLRALPPPLLRRFCGIQSPC